MRVVELLVVAPVASWARSLSRGQAASSPFLFFASPWLRPLSLQLTDRARLHEEHRGFEC